MKNQIKLSEIEKPYEIGSHNEGSWGTPGSQGGDAEVCYYLLTTGEFRARVSNEYGSNQGYHEVQGGEKIQFDCASLDEAIDEARNYCESIENNSDLMRAHQIATNEARTWMRHNVSENPLAKYTIEQLQAEIASRMAQVS